MVSISNRRCCDADLFVHNNLYAAGDGETVETGERHLLSETVRPGHTFM